MKLYQRPVSFEAPSAAISLTFNRVLEVARNSLFVRCVLLDSTESSDPVTRAGIEVVYGHSRDGSVEYHVIQYSDDAPAGRNPDCIGNITERILGDEHKGVSSDQLNCRLGEEIRDWRSRFPLWTSSSAEVYGCGTKGKDRGSLSEIPASHIQLMQHYGALRALIALRYHDHWSDDRFGYLFTFLKRFDTFIRLQYAEWRKVQWTLGDMCPPSRR